MKMSLTQRVAGAIVHTVLPGMVLVSCSRIAQSQEPNQTAEIIVAAIEWVKSTTGLTVVVNSQPFDERPALSREWPTDLQARVSASTAAPFAAKAATIVCVDSIRCSLPASTLFVTISTPNSTQAETTVRVLTQANMRGWSGRLGSTLRELTLQRQDGAWKVVLVRTIIET